MKYESFPIKSGGLMRCCIATIVQNTVPDEGPHELGEIPAEGMTMACMYEPPENPPSILFKNGVWQWNRDEVMAQEVENG